MTLEQRERNWPQLGPCLPCPSSPVSSPSTSSVFQGTYVRVILWLPAAFYISHLILVPCYLMNDDSSSFTCCWKLLAVGSEVGVPSSITSSVRFWQFFHKLVNTGWFHNKKLLSYFVNKTAEVTPCCGLGRILQSISYALLTDNKYKSIWLCVVYVCLKNIYGLQGQQIDRWGGQGWSYSCTSNRSPPRIFCLPQFLAIVWKGGWRNKKMEKGEI